MGKQKDNRPFADRHPRCYSFLGLIVLLVLLAIGILIAYLCFKYIGIGIGKFVDWMLLHRHISTLRNYRHFVAKL